MECGGLSVIIGSFRYNVACEGGIWDGEGSSGSSESIKRFPGDGGGAKGSKKELEGVGRSNGNCTLLSLLYCEMFAD